MHGRVSELSVWLKEWNCDTEAETFIPNILSLIWSWSLGWISETHTSSWIFLLRLRQRTALNLGLFLVLCCHSHAFTNSLINLCSRNSLIMLSVASCFLQSGHVERQRDDAVSPVAVVHGFSDASRLNWSSLKKKLVSLVCLYVNFWSSTSGPLYFTGI